MNLLALLLAATPWLKLDDAQRSAELQAMAALPLNERVVKISDGYLGTTYVLSPLGEGTGKDPDPLIRYDAVDCVTFVEQTLAMAMAASGAPLMPTLEHIRYGGAPAWETRNHVVEAQWLPWNLSHGVLKDIARDYAKDKTRTVTKTLSDATWKEKSARGLGLPDASQPKGEFSLNLIPVKDAVDVLKGAPEGSVVVVVRADRPWLVTRVSHMGLLVQGKTGPMLRHASRSFHRVVDEPISKYVGRNLEYGEWTVEGFALFAPAAAPAP